MSTYWPWWAGAVALGSIAVTYARLTARPMGVSGSFGELAHAERAWKGDSAGAVGSCGAVANALGGGESAGKSPDHKVVDVSRTGAKTPLVAHLAFLSMMAVGAFIAASLRGGVHLHMSMSPTYQSVFGTGAGMMTSMLFGGVLVGAGTRMSGGCTSGHGLSGCARLAPRSLVATATFLGVAIATASLLKWVIA